MLVVRKTDLKSVISLLDDQQKTTKRKFKY